MFSNDIPLPGLYAALIFDELVKSRPYFNSLITPMIRLTPATLKIVFLIFCLSIICYPCHSWAAVAKVEVIHSQDQYLPGGAYNIIFRVNISSPWYLHGAEKATEGLIPTTLSFTDSPAVNVEGVQFPSPEEKKFEYSKEPLEVFAREILIPARLVINEKATTGSHVMSGLLSYQACSDKSCLPPEDVTIPISFSVAPPGTKSKLLNQSFFKSEYEDSKGLKSIPWLKAGSGQWLILLGIFLGGLALNLTPCIYPLIPITVSYFGGSGGYMREKIVIHGLLYISGLAFTNSLLGVTVSLTGGILGAILQNPFILILVAGILVSLAFSFFGFWELQIPLAMSKFASKNFGGYFGTFFMGLTLGVVAAPCLGPFLLGLLAYVAQKGDPFIGFLYFFVLSLGLGLPLSVLAVFSGSIKKLPMSGEWMVWIRKVLGWVLIGMACYMLLPLIPWDIGKSALLASASVVAALHIGWFDSTRSQSNIFSYVKKVLSLVLIIAGILLLVPSRENKTTVTWIPYDKNILLQAIKENKPVMLDFYADWCLPCKAMEKEVFSDPDVVNLSRQFITMRADLTKRHPYQKEIQESFNIRGVPTIVFFSRNGVEEKALRIESYVSSAEIQKRMKKLI